MHDSERRLEVTYEDSSTKQCSTFFLEATRPGYYAAARYVARRQARTGKPVLTKNILGFVDRQKRKYGGLPKSQRRDLGVATLPSTFYSWWAEGDFVDPDMKYWIVTDVSDKELEKATAERILEDVFQKQTSGGRNMYWLGNKPQVKIIPSEQDKGGSVKQIWGGGARNHNRPLEDFFQRCGIPLMMLEGEPSHPFGMLPGGDSPISVELSQEPFVAPKEVRDFYRDVLAKQSDQAKREGSVLFNGKLVRVSEFVPGRDEANHLRYLRLVVQQTDYYTFISSNYAWGILKSDVERQLREQEMQNPMSLRTSQLANPLSVSMSVICRDEHKYWVIVQERNVEKTFHCKRKFQCSAAGMVSWTRDWYLNSIDVFAAARNEIKEELGLTVAAESISFSGLLRDMNSLEVGLVGEVVIDEMPEKVLKLRADSFETVRFYACELTPDGYVSWIRDHGRISEWVPLGVGAIACSLLKRFPAAAVETAFAKIDS
jgi:8-oxo-dGTP pyrophosphatase MutT (NUDIX family)